MSSLRSIRRSVRALGIATLLGLAAVPATAGSGAVIGKAFGDLTERFSKAANPRVPPRRLDHTHELRTPEYVPLGGSRWSTSQVPGVQPPRESLTSRFGRVGADRPASGSVTDGFNHAGRGN